MRDEGGRLLRTYGRGAAKILAYLEDHAFLLEALIALFEASCEERWFDRAMALADEHDRALRRPQRGGFFSTAADGEALIARRKDLEDSPIPAGSSSAAVGLLRLAQLTGEGEYERHALGALAPVAEIAPRYPSAFGHMLQALHWQLSPARPIACPVPGVAPHGSGRARHRLRIGAPAGRRPARSAKARPPRARGAGPAWSRSCSSRRCPTRG